ncbi:hypothetical protein [Phocaeicola sp.]|uniref:hypothetical protein n=1 Tax=Phocaeicola sp. TaxID=2773926 RepID=UPI0023C07ABA|nr:hypothetical protein [Phocaeicola sp.]MDE5678598.1 hypothetical protein [Phocaeicola sp.]
MLYIDKSKHREEGLQVTKDYLNTCCLGEDGRFHNIRYDNRDTGVADTFCGYNRREYRKRLINVLLDNQQSLCCYCLRKLKTAQMEEDSDEVVTLEHIIPRGFAQADVARLPYYQNAPELSPSEVVLTDEYESSAYDQTGSALPHKVAYNNLVASCNGTFPYVRNRHEGKSKICCNEARREENAYPVYFIKEIRQYIDYQINGDIQGLCTIDEDLSGKIDDVIVNANLQCDSLKQIRRLWFILSHVPKDRIYNCHTVAQRDDLLSKELYKTEFFDPDNTPLLHDKFKMDDYWNTFMLYEAFYDIYRSR